MNQHKAQFVITPDAEAQGIGVLCLKGDWNRHSKIPDTSEIIKELQKLPNNKKLIFNTETLKGWDSLLLTFLLNLQDYCDKNAITINRNGLPEGVQRLLSLATTVPERKGARRQKKKIPFLAAVGQRGLEAYKTSMEMIDFIGETFIVFLRFIKGKASYRTIDLHEQIQECGSLALPIVSLISLLIGLILAFVGAVQLRSFGAQIYVADLVGLGMAREMGAMMAAIIMAGRTGAAFAAQIGTMQVNEEIDALTTFGISPIEFLVVPRMIALTLMMPLLCIYADIIGIIGGAIVGIGMLGISPVEYYNQTVAAIGLNDIAIGIFKSIVFGILVALSGCLRGMQCGRSSSAVGKAATSAVVTGIVFIIVFDSLITVITTIIDI